MKFTVENQQFCSAVDPRNNTPYLYSIHPYDETEYHWASHGKSGVSWTIYRAGKRIKTLSGTLTEEQVAQELLNLDRAAHLSRTGGIW